MITYFQTVKDFFETYKTCMFCGSLLTNFLKSQQNTFPLISACVINNHFDFKIRFTSISIQANCFCSINLDNNKVHFSDLQDSYINLSQSQSKDSNIESFNNSFLYLQSTCANCDFDYSYQSTKLNVSKNNKSVIVKPFFLDSESFSINNHLVKNDYLNQKTYYSNDKLNSFGIIPSLSYRYHNWLSIPFIDFHQLDTNSLINKIKTRIIFV